MRPSFGLALFLVAGLAVYHWQRPDRADDSAPATAGEPAPRTSTAPASTSLPLAPCEEPLAQAGRAAETLEKKELLEDAIALLRTARRLQTEAICPRAERPWALHVDLELVRLLLEHSRSQEQAGKLSAAIRAASEAEAVGLPDKNAVEAVRLRLSNLLARRADEAQPMERRRELAEEALEVAPRHPRALYVLASACEEINDLGCALEAAERLKAVRPETRGIDAMIDRLSRHAQVEGRFDDARSDHFVARFEGYAAERVGWAAIRALEKAYFRVGDRLNRRPEQPITVVIYTGDQYKKATLAPDWSGGIFDGKIRLREGGIDEQGGRLDDVLSHEYTHALIARTVKGAVPTWIHEGLAQAMEPSHDAARSLAIVQRYERPLPLEVMTSSFLAMKDRQVVHLAYAQSASMVQALLDKQGALGLARLFDEMNDGASFEAAFERVFYKGPAAFLEEWAGSVR